MLKNYFVNLKSAIFESGKLYLFSYLVLINGVFPCLFSSFSKKPAEVAHKDRILVRFNNKWEVDKEKRKWRLLINDIEFLVHSIKIKCEANTLEEPINGEPKYHFLCLGIVNWIDQNNVEIV